MCAEKWLNIVEKLVVVGEKILLSPSTIGGHMKKGIYPQKNHLKLHLYVRTIPKERERERIETSSDLCTHQKQNIKYIE